MIVVGPCRSPRIRLVADVVVVGRIVVAQRSQPWTKAWVILEPEALGSNWARNSWAAGKALGTAKAARTARVARCALARTTG